MTDGFAHLPYLAVPPLVDRDGNGGLFRVAAVGKQVLLHAGYTVTMSRLFGEYFYRRGGRVDVELDHSHEPIVVTFDLWVAGGARNDPAKRERLDALVAQLEPLLEPTLLPPSKRKRAPVRPVFQRGEWDNLRLYAVFDDLVLGVDSVARAAREHGVEVRVTLREGDAGVEDPLASLRGPPP